MIVWRVEALKHADTALHGIGAARFGGRWNRVGTALVYTSTTLALAAFEKFVHAERQVADIALVALGFELPDDCALDHPAALPADWRAAAAPHSTQQWGSEWARNGRPLAAAVPSVLLPTDHWLSHGEYNVLINCAALGEHAVREVARLPYAYDPRAWK